MFFKIRKIFQSSEIVIVEADTESKARDLANHIDGDYCNDATLYDSVVIRMAEKREDL